MAIHQIYISSQNDRQLPPYFQKAVNAIRSQMPNEGHYLYFFEDLRDWIKNNYDEPIMLAFDKLEPYAYKADLARYLLLYKLGGWYFDIGTKLLNAVKLPEEIELVTFMDMPQYSGCSYACSNGLIFAKPGLNIFKDVINIVYQNIKNEFYGANPLWVSGPVPFGLAVAKNANQYKVLTGQLMDLSPSFSIKNKGFLFPNGLLFALHKQGNSAGDLLSLGAVGTNNYNAMWLARSCYQSTIHLPTYTFLG